MPPRCPKCKKGFMIPNEAFPDDERTCDKCGHLQIRCCICGEWASNQGYGECKTCYNKLNAKTGEDVE